MHPVAPASAKHREPFLLLRSPRKIGLSGYHALSQSDALAPHHFVPASAEHREPSLILRQHPENWNVGLIQIRILSAFTALSWSRLRQNIARNFSACASLEIVGHGRSSHRCPLQPAGLTRTTGLPIPPASAKHREPFLILWPSPKKSKGMGTVPIPKTSQTSPPLAPASAKYREPFLLLR